jgi:hypothetical protein
MWMRDPVTYSYYRVEDGARISEDLLYSVANYPIPPHRIDAVLDSICAMNNLVDYKRVSATEVVEDPETLWTLEDDMI